MITGSQMRMARAALGWSIIRLADESGISTSTIQRAEQVDGIPGMRAPHLYRIQRVLEQAGIIFIDANEHGPGVRFRGH